ncbi:MAG: hypothetical protein NTY47_08790 [Candidatus Omnitrophica bacterium]|nr:hypothetical protein [Candidatus Omnitrophota bacterium]
MRPIKFDFNNMFSFSVAKHGASVVDLKSIMSCARGAHKHLRKCLESETDRINLGLEWANLPFQPKAQIDKVLALSREISRYENVLFLGIGGSFLGLKAAQDALCTPYYNEFVGLRNKLPKIYFDGNNLDPQTLSTLLNNLNPRKTFVVVISKSGETTETKAAFIVAQQWLKKSVGETYGRQIVAITDPKSGSLRKQAEEEQAKDRLSFRSLALLKGVGGRFSEFNMGLLHLSLIGVDIKQILSGAADMYERCSNPDILKNPAYLYAILQNILYRKKGKCVSILMPFSEGLKSTADWYCQLLGESIGKKYGRKIIPGPAGQEQWVMDAARKVNVGITPVSCRGTNDLHSIQQNNIEGENDKAITFIRVEKFADDIKLPQDCGIISGKTYSGLLKLAQEATEWALVREDRPNCTIIMPEVSAYYWGALLFFFEMAIAFEGELLNINAFDQPGVEGYKNYMYVKLDKPGIAPEIKKEINARPLLKKARFSFCDYGRTSGGFPFFRQYIR